MPAIDGVSNAQAPALRRKAGATAARMIVRRAPATSRGTVRAIAAFLDAAGLKP